MARTMFSDDPTAEIYRIIINVKDRNGDDHKWYCKTLGPYVSKVTAKGVLTKEKKALDRHIRMSEKNPNPFTEEVVSYEAWIEEGDITWKRSE